MPDLWNDILTIRGSKVNTLLRDTVILLRSAPVERGTSPYTEQWKRDRGALIKRIRASCDSHEQEQDDD